MPRQRLFGKHVDYI